MVPSFGFSSFRSFARETARCEVLFAAKVATQSNSQPGEPLNVIELKAEKAQIGQVGAGVAVGRVVSVGCGVLVGGAGTGLEQPTVQRMMSNPSLTAPTGHLFW